MLKLATDYQGLKEVLSSAGYGEDHPEGAMVSDAMVAIMLTLDSFKLSKEASTAVLNLISSHGLAELQKLPEGLTDDSWQEFDYGNTIVGDYVRIKKDAYDSVTGAKHNGLVGKLTYMRGYQCSLDYVGLATGNTMKHPADKLESLKRGVK